MTAPLHHVEHGQGRPVVVLHGAGVDHREPEACFEPALRAHGGLRRIYPDLPGCGLSPASTDLRSADGVLDLLRAFVEDVAGGAPVLLVGHSAGGYYAHGFAARWPGEVAGLALVCPLLAGTRDVPEHRPVVADPGLGDAGFRDYLVVQTAEMLDRYRRFVAPGAALADEAAAARIGERWELSGTDGPPYGGPVLVVVGRRDATVGWAAALDLLAVHPRATVAVLDRAGHALPHEQPAALAGLLAGWLDAVDAGR